VEIAVSNRVLARNNLGRFIAECEMAARDTIEELVNEGARLSREFAPVGSKKDPRTAKIRDSIEPQVLSRTSGNWTCTARHALPQELSGAAHPQPGNVTFFWEREGRMWVPGDNTINHPGNPAHPYLRPAYEIVSGKAISVMQKHYPG